MPAVMFSRRNEPSSLLRTAEGTVRIKVQTCDPEIQTAMSLQQRRFTFDLIVEGHSGVGNPLAVHAVQDPAHDGEAHDAEDGLRVASSRYSFHVEKKTFAKPKKERNGTLPPV